MTATATTGTAADRPDSPSLEPARDLLNGLDGQPVGEHAGVYAEVHDRLHAALVSLDHL